MRMLAILATTVTMLLGLAAPTVAADPAPVHGIAIHGEPALPPDFPHFPYVDPNAPKGGVLIEETSIAFDTFNPHILKGVAAIGINQIYDTLLKGSADEPATAYGLIAESLEFPEDRSWAIFNIRPEARWHDGTPITADDVVWTFETLTTAGHPSYKVQYKSIQKVEALSKRRVKFIFASDGSNREMPLNAGSMPVLPKHWWAGKDFAEPTLEIPLGNGAYKVKSFQSGRQVVYERVKDYWAKDLPVNVGQENFDEIRYEIFRDRDVATEAFKSGAFDMRGENSAKRWATQFDFKALDDGIVVKETLEHERPERFQAFFFNIRRPQFQDRRVRWALAHAFDFEWTNKTLMYSAYKRAANYFLNSELASSGLPEGDELALLEPHRDALPPEVFTETYTPPSTDGSGTVRKNLRTALKLLRDAGWVVKDGKLSNEAGEAFTFELLLIQPSLEKLALPMKENMAKLGIEMTIRTVDASQYVNRIQAFDYDMFVFGYGPFVSPGNELRSLFGSEAADLPGGGNWIGIKDPVVDALIEKVIAAETREDLVIRSRALDRVLLWGHYVIPQFYLNADRMIYWDKFGRPDRAGRYASDAGFPTTWWFDEAKAAKVEAWKKTRSN